ncbi:MAG: hypothetical protein HC783_17710, partial [Rhodobacteraceae bacterium]|nr:hypothetical protein [Paracoccaceae bacterium]
MRRAMTTAAALGLAVALSTGIAAAELKDETFRAGDQQVWIEVKGAGEVMSVGPTDAERLAVLAAYDIEIDTFATDELGVALLGVP